MRKPLTWLIGLSALGGSLAVAGPLRTMGEGATGSAIAATPELHWNPIVPRALTRRSASEFGVSGRFVSAVYYTLPLYVAADWNRLAGMLEEVPVSLPLYVAADWNRLAGLLEG